MTFRSAVAGWATGIRSYRSRLNGDAHVGHLSASGGGSPTLSDKATNLGVDRLLGTDLPPSR